MATPSCSPSSLPKAPGEFTEPSASPRVPHDPSGAPGPTWSHTSSRNTSSSSRSSWLKSGISVARKRPVWLEHSKSRGVMHRFSSCSLQGGHKIRGSRHWSKGFKLKASHSLMTSGRWPHLVKAFFILLRSSHSFQESWGPKENPRLSWVLLARTSSLSASHCFYNPRGLALSWENESKSF